MILRLLLRGGAQGKTQEAAARTKIVGLRPLYCNCVRELILTRKYNLLLISNQDQPEAFARQRTSQDSVCVIGECGNVDSNLIVCSQPAISPNLLESV